MKFFTAFLILMMSFSAAEAAAPKCEAMQKALYSKSTIKIRMVFGYKDARPARFVGDRHERLAFIEKITQACEEGVVDTCGFARSPENADLFMRRITVSGKEKKILLWVVNSSVGTDDQENKSDPFQAWKSKYAEQAFLTGLKDADVVFYNGHSRFGGGPDFTSPDLAEDGTVDPAGYQEIRPGLTKLLGALEEVRRPKDSPFKRLKILGLFSCSSSQHFNEEIRKVSHAGFVSSHVLMYYSDALNQSLRSLKSVLTQECPKTITFN
jgi:hypothetical protein